MKELEATLILTYRAQDPMGYRSFFQGIPKACLRNPGLQLNVPSGQQHFLSLRYMG